MFEPQLTPDSTSSGGRAFKICSAAIITQSVGVPLTAKWRSSIARRRKGDVKVREWDAPDCSVSGATTQTSSEIARAIFSATPSPGA